MNSKIRLLQLIFPSISAAPAPRLCVEPLRNQPLQQMKQSLSLSARPTSSLTPYSFSTFFFSCLKHSSIRSWNGRKSSVTLLPWSEIPPPSNGIYKHRERRGVNAMASIKVTRIFVGCIAECVGFFSLSCWEYLPGDEVFEAQQFVPVLRVLLGVLLREESLHRGLNRRRRHSFATTRAVDLIWVGANDATDPLDFHKDGASDAF